MTKKINQVGQKETVGQKDEILATAKVQDPECTKQFAANAVKFAKSRFGQQETGRYFAAFVLKNTAKIPGNQAQRITADPGLKIKKCMKLSAANAVKFVKSRFVQPARNRFTAVIVLAKAKVLVAKARINFVSSLKP